MALITLDQALEQLHLGSGAGAEYTADVTLKMEQATAHVIIYLKRPDHGWTIDTDPAADPEFAIVQGAILEVLTNLFYDRNDRDKVATTDGPLTPRIKNALGMLRMPTVK